MISKRYISLVKPVDWVPGFGTNTRFPLAGARRGRFFFPKKKERERICSLLQKKRGLDEEAVESCTLMHLVTALA